MNLGKQKTDSNLSQPSVERKPYAVYEKLQIGDLNTIALALKITRQLAADVLTGRYAAKGHKSGTRTVRCGPGKIVKCAEDLVQSRNDFYARWDINKSPNHS
jgi:hypothetical protein